MEQGFRLSNVAEELYLLRFVIEGLLSLYCFTTQDIYTQLLKVAIAAHVLFILQRNLKTFLPNQLYHDLQATFEDIFYCAAKWKIYHPDLPLYLLLLANDILERIFSNIRLKYKHCTIDNLEMIYATRAMSFCDQILMKHPSWVKKQQNVMKRLTLDYSCTSDWDPGKQLVSDIDFTSVWNSGRAFAETELNRTKHKGQKW